MSMAMITQIGSRSMLFVTAMAALAAGCKTQLDDQGQIGDSVGEVMASMDESASGGSSMAMLPVLPILRTPDELKGPLWRRALDGVMPSAYAASCFPFSLSACAAGVRTETFDACTVGLARLDGAVTLTFSDTAACTLGATGDAVNRTASFTLTGLYGGTLTVTSPGGGQTLTRTDAGFTFAVPGMERVLTGPAGHVLFDLGTATTTPLTITGTSRANFAIVSGVLVVTHKLAGYAVTLEPQNLAWASTCNCAVSGSLTGTVSSGGGKENGKSATVTITSCGHADVTIDGDTESVVLDRCAGI
jgi:hypothetical protein